MHMLLNFICRLPVEMLVFPASENIPFGFRFVVTNTGAQVVTASGLEVIAKDYIV